jgi:hypothetical protein
LKGSIEEKIKYLENSFSKDVGVITNHQQYMLGLI